MNVLVLAAGYGTRLKALGEDKPKALLEVKGKALIEHILDRVKDLKGLKKIYLVTNDKFYGIFCQWAKTYSRGSIPLEVINDRTKTPDERLGSIGDIHFALKNHSLSGDLLVVGGDNLFDFDLKKFAEFALQKDKAVTIGLYDIGSLKDATQYGVVSLSSTHKLSSFDEKPAKPKSSLVAMCFYYFPKATLGYINDYLSAGHKADRAGDYIRWLHLEHEVYGHTFKGKWYDIGSVESYHDAQLNF